MTRWEALPRPTRLLVGAALVVALAALPWLDAVPLVGPLVTTSGTSWTNMLFTICYYVLLCLGLNVVVGFAGLLDLGYVGFFAVGAYSVAVLTSPDSSFRSPLTWVACVPVALVATMGSGLLLGWPTLRLRGDYLAIVTLGFAEIIRLSVESVPVLRGDRGFTDVARPPGHYTDGPPVFDPTKDMRPYFWLGLAVVVLVVLAVRNLERSRVGRAWVAVREDEDAATVMGVESVKFKLWAFAIGAAVAGLGGVLFAGKVGFVNSDPFDLQLSILVLGGVVIGGSGNVWGAVLGGTLIAYVPEKLRDVRLGGHDLEIFGQTPVKLRYLLFGLVMVLVMIYRPGGLFSGRRTTVDPRTPARRDDEQQEAPALALGEEAAARRGEGPLLVVEELTVRFGGLVAVNGVGFEVGRAEIVGVIGPNGAGKTSCFNAVTGVYTPTSGRVLFEGVDLVGKPRHAVARAGISRTFQNIRLFPEMSALENVVVGADSRHGTSVPGALLRLPRHRREESAARAEAMALLRFVGLGDVALTRSASLAYGQQRRLEIARALATRPKLLCLDEPAAGFTPVEKEELLLLIRSIRDAGISVLLIEHDMRLVMNVTDRVVVLDFGRTIATGTPAEVQQDPAVVAAYLGVPTDAA